MRYSLDKFSLISETHLNTLAAIGIDDTDQLLDAAATPKARHALARRLDVAEAAVEGWVSLADLVRIAGIGTAFAEIFVQSGACRHVQDFVKNDGQTAEIMKLLQAYKEKNAFTGRLPSTRELDEIFSEAKELRPRLIFSDVNTDAQTEFRLERLKKVYDEHKRSFLYYAVMLGFTLLAILLTYALNVSYVNDYIAEPIAVNAEIDQIMRQVFVLEFKALRYSLLTLLGVVFALVIAEIMIYQLTMHLIETKFVFWLFKRPSEQDFFRYATSINIKKQSRIIWWAIIAFGVMALGVVLFFFRNMLVHEIDENLFLKYLSQLIIFIGVFLGVLVSYPVVEFFVQIRREKKSNENDLQKFLVYRFSQAFLIPVVVLLFTHVVMPQSLHLHDAVYQARIEPSITQEIEQVRGELADLSFEEENERVSQEYFLAAIDNKILPDLKTEHVMSETWGQYLNDVLLPLILRSVIWLILTAYALLFVIPYLMLGGWKRGLLYIFILFISFQTENFISNYAPTWFLLDDKSISAWLVIAFFVLANALLFDWLVNISGKKVCVSCEIPLDEDTLFCPECGFMQN